MGTVVKHMNITTLASAVGLAARAKQLIWTFKEEAAELYLASLDKFGHVIASGLNDINILLKEARVKPRPFLLFSFNTTNHNP